MAKIPLVGSQYTSRSLAASAQSCVNLIVEAIEVALQPAIGVGDALEGKNKAALYGAPGRHYLAGLAGCKGLFSGGGVLYATEGTTLTSYDYPGGVFTQIASELYAGVEQHGGPDAFPATMVGNGNQLLIVSGAQNGVSSSDSSIGGAPVPGGYAYISNPQPSWSSAHTYAAGEEAIYSGLLYYSLQSNNTGNTPTGLAPYWALVNDLVHTPGTGMFGAAAPTLCRFTIGGGPGDDPPDGATTDGITPNVTVTYPPEPAWDIATVYGAGAVVSYSGLNYVSVIGANSGNQPNISPTFWALLTPPDVFVGEMAGQPFFLDGTPYRCIAVNSPTSITLSSVPPAGTGQTWSAPAGDPITAVMCTFLDGFFILQRPIDAQSGRQINISALNDGTSWDPLDFAVKEAYPDHIATILADHEQLFIWGTQKSECWQDTGDIFPFARIAGAAVSFGATSSWSQAAIGGNVFFLGGDGTGGTTAYGIVGFTPTRISTHAIEQQWRQQSMLNVVSYSYLEEGHYFWVIQSAAGQTFCWDITSGTWTRRASWTGGKAGSGVYAPYGTKFHTFIPEWGGVHVTSDGTNLYQSSVDFYDDDGIDIHWERALPYQYQAGHQLYFDRLDIDMETGGSVGVNPTIELDWSDDRGNTFGTGAGGVNVPISVSTGAAGDTTARIYWNQLGGSRGRVLRLSQTGQNKVAIIDADLQMRAGAH